jgi:ketosteroid isomerase-like protein
MTNKNWLLTLTIFYILSYGSQHALAQNADVGKVKAALNSVNTNYGQAFVKGDSSLFLNSYTTDACLLPANSPAICGTQGQLFFFKFAYRSGVRNIIFTTLDVYGLTDQYVTEQGNYEMFGANNSTLGKGKYLVLWKKTTEGWKMFRDIFNSNAPAMR